MSDRIKRPRMNALAGRRGYSEDAIRAGESGARASLEALGSLSECLDPVSCGYGPPIARIGATKPGFLRGSGQVASTFDPH